MLLVHVRAPRFSSDNASLGFLLLNMGGLAFTHKSAHGGNAPSCDISQGPVVRSTFCARPPTPINSSVSAA